MKLRLKNNLSKSEESVDTEPLACTDLVCSISIFFKFKRHFSQVAGHTYMYLMVKQKSLGR